MTRKLELCSGPPKFIDSAICSKATKNQPLIKWPGGKRALVNNLLDHAPSTFGTYYEPFMGGGALFFALAPSKAVLGDLNHELISCYKCVKEYPHKLIQKIRRYKNTEYDYYKIRDSIPRTEITKAARFLYLTRLSFNGIHRVNLRGEFNVPYGKKTHLSSVDSELLLEASLTLQSAKLRVGDFKQNTRDAKAGDFIYFDPPYTVAHENNGFIKYNERIFSWSDQVRLAQYAKELATRGCRVLVSNANHPSITALYKNCEHHIIERHSVIAASSQHRRKITESLFILGGHSFD